MAVGINREQFLHAYGEALRSGEASAFVGAGLSRAVGFVDWKRLLQEFAKDLKLDLEIETDLPLVAQYHLNREGHDRTRLHKKLVAEFAGPAEPSLAHTILARLPIEIFWTSNYDSLIEDSLRANGRDVRIKNSSSSLTSLGSRRGSIVYKLHGDLADPKTIVITRDDYQNYIRRYPVFRDRLRADLAERTFLFLGFSFTDPHLDLILGELRSAFGTEQRQHLVIMRREQRGRRSERQYRYAINRQKLKVEDLENFGIRTLLVEDYDEVPELLRALELRHKRQQVLVSGALETSEPLGRPWLEEFSQGLGTLLVDEGFNIVSGFGKGLGPLVVAGALESLYRAEATNIDRRLQLKPFPYATGRRDLYTRYRESLAAVAGIAIFIAGNKRDATTGELVVSDGVLEEFELAMAHGLIPIPVGASGWAAAEIWSRVREQYSQYMPATASRAAFNKLNSRTLTASEALDAIRKLLVGLRHR